MVSWLKSLTLVFLLPLELFAEGKVSGAVNQSHVFEQGKIVGGRNTKPAKKGSYETWFNNL